MTEQTSFSYLEISCQKQLEIMKRISHYRCETFALFQSLIRDHWYADRLPLTTVLQLRLSFDTSLPSPANALYAKARTLPLQLRHRISFSLSIQPKIRSTNITVIIHPFFVISFTPIDYVSLPPFPFLYPTFLPSFSISALGSLTEHHSNIST